MHPVSNLIKLKRLILSEKKYLFRTFSSENFLYLLFSESSQKIVMIRHQIKSRQIRQFVTRNVTRRSSQCPHRHMKPIRCII